MCNLYNIRATRAEFVAYFSAQDEWRRDLDKDYVAPGRLGWVITAGAGSARLPP